MRPRWIWRKAILGFIRKDMPEGDDRIDATHPKFNTKEKILKLWTGITMFYYRALTDEFAYVDKPFAPEPTPPSVGEYDFPSIKDFYHLKVISDGKTVIYKDEQNDDEEHRRQLFFTQEPYVYWSVMFR